MKLVMVYDGANFFLADEATGAQVENVVVTSSTLSQPHRELTVLGSPFGRLNLGLGHIEFSGEFSSGSSLVSKRRIFIVANNKKDYLSHTLSLRENRDKDTKFLEYIPVTKEYDLRGQTIREYEITPQAINNPEFGKIVERLKASCLALSVN